jgi:hypothetical protein
MSPDFSAADQQLPTGSCSAATTISTHLYEIGAGTSEIRRMLIGLELFEKSASSFSNRGAPGLTSLLICNFTPIPWIGVCQ